MTRLPTDPSRPPRKGVRFTSGGWSVEIDSGTARNLVSGVARVAVNLLVFLSILTVLGVGLLVADLRYGILTERPAEQGSNSGE